METKIAYIGESILYDFDVSKVARLQTTDTIASVVSVTSDTAGIVISVPTHDSNKLIQFRASNFSTKVTHLLTVIFTTTSGDTLHSFAKIKVQ